MKGKECFLDKAIEEIMNREDLLCIDDNGLVKYQYTETEIKKMVDDECNDLFEEYKEDWEFEDSNVMDTPLRKAMRDAGMKESDFR